MDDLIERVTFFLEQARKTDCEMMIVAVSDIDQLLACAKAQSHDPSPANSP